MRFSIQNSVKYPAVALCFLFFAATVISCAGAEKPEFAHITISIESKKTKAAIPIDVLYAPERNTRRHRHDIHLQTR